VRNRENESLIPNPESRLEALIRERGPLTVAAFMDLALYDPDLGYYARAAQRSGRAGDFFTSVDVGPLFGELLEIQLAEMFELLRHRTAEDAKDAETNNSFASSEGSSASSASSAVPAFDLVEAGAGNGRLAADILRAAKSRDAAFYESLRLHLVEASAAARTSQRSTLADAADRLASSSSELPESFEGVLIANELLDALPVHQVVMREEGLRETYVDGPALRTIEGPPSTPALQECLDRLHVQLEPGWRVEINLRAVDWMRDAARRLRRGFIVVIDYGHEARELYSPTHSAGTLTTYAAHRSAGPELPLDSPPWLRNPGDQDLTAHVDFTSIREAANAEGMTTLGFLDQTYFLLGLISAMSNPQSGAPNPQSAIRNPQSLKTLIMPGGLGSTHKVLILGKGVGTPALRGCSFKVRVT
jgi:SAM-dependent MidA family methyltransferase